MGKILPLVNREDADIQALAYPASHRAGMQPNPLDETRMTVVMTS